MAKKLIPQDLVSRLACMRAAPNALGPGHVRLAADEASDEAEIFVYGDIGGWWDGVDAQEFAKEVAGLDVNTINVRLKSPGGIVYDGVAIYNALAMHQKAKIVVHIDGIAASIASVIAMAGDEIRIGEGSHVMIHKPWSFTMGDAAAMRKEADILDKLEAGIIDIYAARTGKDRAQLEQWVADETWFRGQEAVDAGFADVLVPAKKKDKSAALARSAVLPSFKRAPNDLLEPGDAEPDSRVLENLLRDVEGLSITQAKRVAVLARATSVPRDVDSMDLRDEGSDQLRRLAAAFRRG
jgi:ATP-dependent protease ClpP protease subunit